MKNIYLSMLLGGLALFPFTASATGEVIEHSSAYPAIASRQLFATARPNSLAGLQQLALSLVNRDRQQQGLPALTHNSLLHQVAQSHAEDMIRRNYLSHYAKDGSTPEERVRSAGGQMFAGENILSYHLNRRKRRRSDLISEFQSLFFNSTRHRTTMMRSRYSQFGYGFATAPDGRIIAVQLFGVPDSP